MATELVLQHWCDICLADDNRTTAVSEYQLGRPGSTPLGVELCESHGSVLREAWELVERYGQPTDANPTPTPTARPPVTRHFTAETGKPCPICDPPRFYKGLTHMRSHLRTYHQIDAAEYARLTGKPYTPHPCLWCEFVAVNRVGLLAHARNVHPSKYDAAVRAGVDPGAPAKPDA